MRWLMHAIFWHEKRFHVSEISENDLRIRTEPQRCHAIIQMENLSGILMEFQFEWSGGSGSVHIVCLTKTLKREQSRSVPSGFQFVLNDHSAQPVCWLLFIDENASWRFSWIERKKNCPGVIRESIVHILYVHQLPYYSLGLPMNLNKLDTIGRIVARMLKWMYAQKNEEAEWWLTLNLLMVQAFP